MKRIKLIVAYDGTDYRGWQIQKNGITIEEVLNRELSRLLGEEIHVIGASRTDSGVHALGNVAVFDTDTHIPAEKLSYALNKTLPGDIAIQDSCEVPADWHPRKCVSKKTYEYRILNRTFPLPTLRRDSYLFRYDLDANPMRQAAAVLIGTHDFRSFCSAGGAPDDTVRTVYSCEVERADDIIGIRICGSGFLYNMVRIIAGTLIEIGAGRAWKTHMSHPASNAARIDQAERDAAEYISSILAAADRRAAGPTAPACGLTLLRIDYAHPPQLI